jgi:hypothetical protein
MIIILNQLVIPPRNAQQALELIHVADLAGQLVLNKTATLEQLAANETEAEIITLFAQMRARERYTYTQYQRARLLKSCEAFELAFVGSLPCQK